MYRIIILLSLFLLLSSRISTFLDFPIDCPSKYSFYLYEKAVNKVSNLIRKTDGTYNNFHHPLWGSINQTLIRLAPSAFEDFRMFPSGLSRPSPRVISNQVCASNDSDFQPDPRKLSGLFLVWGQFFTHDLHHTLSQQGEKREEWNIEVPKGDKHFDPDGTGNKTIPFVRSIYDEKLHKNHPRQQINLLSSWFDGQLIYGSGTRTPSKLRMYKKGKLKLSEENLLLKNEKNLFVSGDSRVNENIVLTAINTLFVRQHNRICDQVSSLFPYMSDEQIFSYAKNYVSALIAKITYDDYLPLLLGENFNLHPYRGYSPEIDPSISNIFSTASIRFGHFTVADNFVKMDNEGNIVQQIPVRDGIRRGDKIVKNEDIGMILKGEAHNVMKKRTIRMSDELRNFLVFSPQKRNIFLDLAALNIQRGRDHGLPDYNTFRRFMGLKQYHEFDQITKDKKTVEKLKDCYKDINLLDAFIGIIAEEAVVGGVVGELGAGVIKNTMERIRSGDRFWYQYSFPEELVKEIKETSLADIIRRNTGMNVEDNVFIVSD